MLRLFTGLSCVLGPMSQEFSKLEIEHLPFVLFVFRLVQRERGTLNEELPHLSETEEVNLV